ncbi:MAG: hypothetical protein AABW75_01040 [Nanoarchaeota archaeon]
MDKGVLEVELEEEKLGTLSKPILYKKSKEALVVPGIEMQGSIIFLYRVGFFPELLVGSYIVPSDYDLDNKRILQIEQGVESIVYLTKSKNLRNYSIDESNSEFLSKLLPPFPTGTKDFQNHNLHLIRHFFTSENESLLVEIVKGMKS